MKIIVDHDFETFSDIDVRRVGAHKYARHPSTDVLCLTWGTTPEDTQTWVPHRQKTAAATTARPDCQPRRHFPSAQRRV